MDQRDRHPSSRRNGGGGAAIFWALAAVAAAIGALASIADHARARRRDIDHVGWMPWPLVLILALTLAATFAALALKS